MSANRIASCAASHAEDESAFVQSILGVWCVTDDATRELGALWYPEARSTVDSFWPDHVDRARGITAALTPRAYWATTLVWSRILIDAWRSGADIPRVSTTRNRELAWRIASGERPLDVLGGQKVRSFYRNLSGNTRTVTVDVWAARAAGLDMPDGKSLTRRQYAEISMAYRRAARLTGTEPAELQAAVWIQVRGKAS
jgi:hypothetical protein